MEDWDIWQTIIILYYIVENNPKKARVLIG